MENKLREKNPDIELTNEDFQFLFLPVYIDSYLTSLFQYYSTFTMHWNDVPVRKVENFLFEIQRTLEDVAKLSNEEKVCIGIKNSDDVKKYKRIVILFFALKHFNYPLFQTLNAKDSIVDQLKLKYQEKQYTIWELIRQQQRYKQSVGKSNQKADTKSSNKRVINEKGNTQEINLKALSHDPVDIKEILDGDESQGNRFNFILLNMFGYNFRVKDISVDGFDNKDVENEASENIIAKDNNEQIDRIIWYLMACGKSDHTDKQEFVNRMDAEVCSKNPGEQEEAFHKLCSKYYYDEGKKDNKTIFRLGMNPYLNIFQAYRGCLATTDQWKRLVLFYFNIDKENTINTTYFEIINYCDLRDKETYLLVLQNFIDRRILANPLGIAAYRKFLKVYLTKMRGFGYIIAEHADYIDMFEPDMVLDKNLLKQDIFDPMMHELQELKEDLTDIPSVIKEVDILIKFIEKNVELTEAPGALQENKLDIKSDMHTEYQDQKEVDRLISVPDAEFSSEAEKSYGEGHIMAYRLQDIIRQKKKNESGKP